MGRMKLFLAIMTKDFFDRCHDSKVEINNAFFISHQEFGFSGCCQHSKDEFGPIFYLVSLTQDFYHAYVKSCVMITRLGTPKSHLAILTAVTEPKSWWEIEKAALISTLLS